MNANEGTRGTRLDDPFALSRRGGQRDPSPFLFDGCAGSCDRFLGPPPRHWQGCTFFEATSAHVVSVFGMALKAAQAF